MKSKIEQAINLIFFILITNTQFLQAHNSLNGGCKNHCKGSVSPVTKVKELDNINNKNQIEDNYSCLTKSLCRGWKIFDLDTFWIEMIFAW